MKEAGSNIGIRNVADVTIPNFSKRRYNMRISKDQFWKSRVHLGKIEYLQSGQISEKCSRDIIAPPLMGMIGLNIK